MVAGVGFFTDAYSIFAINMVIPMLGIIYYGGEMPRKYETALSVVTLGGSIIGQVAFGFAADIWGRRKMYGLELIITIAATLVSDFAYFPGALLSVVVMSRGSYTSPWLFC